MPYIVQEYRPSLDKIVVEVTDSSTKESWSRNITALIVQIATGLYGTSHESGSSVTRYYLQNELIGVLFCASLEFGRRTKSSISSTREMRIWEGHSPEMQVFAERALESIPGDEETQRPAHLNYFITELILGGVNAGWIDEEKACDFLASIAEAWFHYHTSLLEIHLIAQNGDTPGYTTLLSE